MSRRRGERRRFGLLATVLTAVGVTTALDSLHVLTLSVPGAPQTPALLWLALALWALAMASLLTPMVAGLSATASALGRWLEGRRPWRGRPRLARATAVCLLCLPSIALLGRSLFQGRGVARVPWLATVGPVAATVTLSVGVVIGWIALERLRGRGAALRGLAAVAAAALVGGLFYADARLFVGLYEVLHLYLGVGVLLVLVATSGALLGVRPEPLRRSRRFLLLGGSAVGLLTALLALSLVLRGAPQTRADLIERSLYASRGVSLLASALPLGQSPPLQTEALTYEAIEAEYLPAELAGGRPSSGERPDILLFSIDATNADRFPGRGYNPEVMPNIAKLLPRATRFDRAYTTIPETQYAVPGLIMSTTADLGPAAAVRESGETIASALRRVGYATYWVYEAQDLFQGGGVLNNLDFEGFDGRFGIDDNRAFASSDRVIEILEAQQGRPIFIWTHIFAPHAPYSPPEQFRRFGDSRSGLYDGELNAADAYIGRVLDHLRSRGRLENTVVMITADHGEWSGEGGRFGHGADVRERTVNIPLLVMGPGVERGQLRRDPVSILDIAPTLVDVGGGVIPESFEGISLAPALRGEPVDHPPVLTFTEGHGQTAALVDDYKLVFNRDKTVIRLYNHINDRDEARDLAAVDGQRVREMLAQVAGLDLERAVATQVREEGAQETLSRYRERVADESLSEAERALAARALGWVRSGQTSRVLIDLLTDRTPLPRAVRQWLAQGLSRRGADTEADRAFSLAADDQDPMVRVLALRSLRRTTRATDAFEAWADDDDLHIRRAVASLIVEPGSRARPDEAASERLVHDEDSLVRALALSSLERLRVGDEGPILVAALRDEAPAVRLAAARRCGRRPAGCLVAVLQLISGSEEIGERLALLDAVSPALTDQPARWAELLEGPAAQRALAYQGLGHSDGAFDQELLERLATEGDDRAREALIRAVGERRLGEARPALIAQQGEDNFALGQAAADALRQIGLRSEDVSALVDVFPRARQMQTKVNLLHLFGTIDRIDDPRVFEIAEEMRRTPMKDHHLIRALVEVYSRLTDPRAERYRIDHPMYTNFGYQFWLYGYSLTPEHPRAGDEVQLRTIWSIRWNQPQSARQFIHLVGGPRQIPINRSVVAGQPISRWPRCRLMVDEVTLPLPPEARQIRVLAGWTRGGRLPVVYGEADREQGRALITTIRLEPPVEEGD